MFSWWANRWDPQTTYLTQIFGFCVVALKIICFQHEDSVMFWILTRRFVSFCWNLASEMRAALILLPFLLPESAISTLDNGKCNIRSYFKPSLVDSQQWFIGLQKVSYLFVIYAWNTVSSNCLCLKTAWSVSYFTDIRLHLLADQGEENVTMHG